MTNITLGAVLTLSIGIGLKCLMIYLSFCHYESDKRVYNCAILIEEEALVIFSAHICLVEFSSMRMAKKADTKTHTHKTHKMELVSIQCYTLYMT